jgi:hypothetical protein
MGGGYSRKGDSGGKDSCDTKGNNCGKGGGEGVSCGDQKAPMLLLCIACAMLFAAMLFAMLFASNPAHVHCRNVVFWFSAVCYAAD